MAEQTPFLAGEGVLWVQPDGPNTVPRVLGCHVLGDVTEPKGDVTLLRCRDLSGVNRWRFVGAFQNPPDLVTSSIETDVLKTADYLERVSCPFGLYVLMTKCGRLDVFNNYDRMFVLGSTYVTQDSMSNLTAPRDSNERAMQSFDISAKPPLLRAFALTAARQSTSETRALNDIVLTGADGCASGCGEATHLADDIAAAGDALAGSAMNTANLLVTANGGTAWSPSATDPFTTGEHVSSLVSFRTGRDTVRIIAARGVTDAAAPAEIAVTDDGGATWTRYNVGSTNGEFIPGNGGLFSLDQFHTWAATSGGRIFFSADSGSTWTVQENATISPNDYLYIYFANTNDGMAVGEGDIVAKTTDGGATWEAATSTGGGDINNVVTSSGPFWWIGTNVGELYYSGDGGETWHIRHNWIGDGVGQVRDITFLALSDGYFGAMAVNSGAPLGSVLVTVDGGYTWRKVDNMPTNSGLNSLVIAGTDLIYAVGEAQSGTAFIAKITPSV